MIVSPFFELWYPARQDDALSWLPDIDPVRLTPQLMSNNVEHHVGSAVYQYETAPPIILRRAEFSGLADDTVSAFFAFRANVGGQRIKLRDRFVDIAHRDYVTGQLYGLGLSPALSRVGPGFWGMTIEFLVLPE